MKILIVFGGIIPTPLYGGTSRVIWYLGQELDKLGHQVSYLVKKGSHCPFADVSFIDDEKLISEQIPESIDLVHFNMLPPDIDLVKKPYVLTIHGNGFKNRDLPLNSIFVSKSHAQRFSSNSYVDNGLDWDDYMKPDLDATRTHFHFLGNAAWKVKNVRGAIDIIKQTKSERINVLGGNRLNFKMGFRFTLTPRASFFGMVGGEKKFKLLNHSKGLVFPVRWHEPFGLAITESLYYGCPVFGTPYGSLPDLVTSKVGFLSNKQDELVNAVNNVANYSTRDCHNLAVDKYNSKTMALSYLSKYEQVLNGNVLNSKPPYLASTPGKKLLDWQ